jgi:hypothetical protein
MENKKIIPIDACFLHYSESKIFSGENQIHCKFCHKKTDLVFLNRIYSLPPIIILIFNRGEGNTFDCEVDFPQILNLEKFIQNKTNYNYKLKGVIAHLKTNDFKNHLIAFCRHRIDDKWYCYNDTIVTLCKDQENEFRKVTPYILFYESINGDKNFVFEDNDNKYINQNDLNYNNNINQAMSYGNNNNGFGMNFINMNNVSFNNQDNMTNIFNMYNNIMLNMNSYNSMNNMNNFNNINNINRMNNMYY